MEGSAWPATFRLEEAAKDFATLARQAGRPEVAAVGDWTVADTIAHVALLLSMYERIVAGQGSPATSFDSDEFNREALAQFAERNMAVLAGSIEESAQRIARALASQPAGARLAWHAGVNIRAEHVAGLLIGELRVHGLDIARAERVRWAITNDDAVLIFQSLAMLAPTLIADTRGIRGTVNVKLRRAETFRFIAEASGLRVERAGSVRHGRADLHVSAQPTALVLLAYNRTRTWNAVLSGRVRAWGWRPWLGVSFSRLIPKP